jgi:CBS domain-containing protein
MLDVIRHPAGYLKNSFSNVCISTRKCSTFKLLQPKTSKRMGKVRNILQAKGSVVFSVEPSVTVYKAIELMSQKNIGGLIITDHRGEKLLGIFTERDYARRLILKGKSSKDTQIGEIMTENPITVTPDNSIEDCMKIMTDRHIRHLPVVDEGKLVGMISIGDVVRFVIDEQRTIIEDLEQYITGHHQ